LTLKNKELETIAGISTYDHLQVLDISYNNIEDLSPLSSLAFLISLDASHNNLKDVLNFKAPLGLREVNLSHNKIEAMSDLSDHKSLNKLILDYNSITEIFGLQGCRRLKVLSIANNLLEKLSGLEKLPLTYLDLSNNKIRRVENIGTLKDLQIFDLSYNSIRSLRGIQSHDLLHTLKLSNNELIDLSEVRYIRDLPLLRVLDLSLNPIQNLPDYRLSILLRIPSLIELDNDIVSPEEKVASQNLYQPNREIIAARNHMTNLLKSYQQPVKLLNSTLSSTETPYPMLILTGPSGSCKRLLINRLCQEFSNFFGHGVSFTTRGLRENEKVPRESEVDGVDYYFVTKEDFEREASAGKFIQTCQLYSSQYGVSRDTIEAIAKEGLACVLHMELEGVMVFKNTHFEPRYILILPETSKIHKDRMISRGFYSESHINQALERVSLYEEMNREHPGYFDMAICFDDFDDCYKRLKKIVMEYLGLSPASSTASITPQSGPEYPISHDTSPFHHTSDKPYGHSSAGSPVKSWGRSGVMLQGGNSAPSSGLARSPKSPVEIASFQRRFKKLQCATLGVTSTSQEQLSRLRPPLSATGIPNSWIENDDFDLSYETKRSASAPNGHIATFSGGTFDISQGPDAPDESDSERVSEDSELSSAHAGFIEERDELGSQTDRSSVVSVMS